MKVSIITVCYNSAITIRDTIESVLHQNYQDIEYIIVDGKSSDGTMDIINEYHDTITKVISEPDKGIYDAMNKGIKASTGELIGILNSDDFYEYSNAIADVVEAIKQQSGIDMIFGDVQFVKPIDLNTVVRTYNARRFKPWKLRFGWMPPHPATFIKKKVYDQVGLYTLGYKIASDFEMFVRALLVHHFNITRVDKTLVRMREGGVSTSGIRSNIISSKEIVKACRTNHIYTNIIMVLSRLPFKFLELFKR